MKKKCASLDELIKRHTKKESREEYSDKVLRNLEAAFQKTGSQSLSFETGEGTVRFEKDPYTGGLSMFVNGIAVPQENIPCKIAEIDHFDENSADNGFTRSLTEKIDTKGIRRYAGRKTLDATLNAAKKQAQDASNTSKTLLKGILHILTMGHIR